LGKKDIISKEITKTIIKETEMRLSDITYKDLPSYEIGFEKGIEQGIEEGEIIGEIRGINKGKIETAILMIKNFKLPVSEVAKKLDIDEEILYKELNKWIF